jgi:phosphoglycerate kinase
MQLEMPIAFCEDCIENGPDFILTMEEGEVVLCENIRLYDGEKKNDEAFAKKLATLGDVYVNDAFSVSHRSHASIVQLPKILPSFMGLQFEQEIKNLSLCFEPKHPFVCVLGGLKIDTKMPLITKFLKSADMVIVCGALSNDLFKEKGYEVGVSAVSTAKIDVSDLISNPKIIVPTDVVIENEDKERVIKDVTAIGKKDRITDAGPQSVKMFKTVLAQASMVLWNGPLGEYEAGFKEPTLKIAEMIASGNAVSIVGGGDTVAAISELNNEDKFTFVSTGGGAMLDFLAEGTLPGIEALKHKI